MPGYWSTGPVLSRQLLVADSTLTGLGMGAPATETAHTPITFSIVSGLLPTARRTIRFRAMLNPPSANAADTWRTRLRFGAAGVGGVILVDSGAWDLAANLGVYIEGMLQIMTVGGTFTSYCRLVNEATAGVIESFVASGAIDTALARDLTVTGESSTNLAAQAMVLRHFEAEVYSAQAS